MNYISLVCFVSACSTGFEREDPIAKNNDELTETASEALQCNRSNLEIPPGTLSVDDVILETVNPKIAQVCRAGKSSKAAGGFFVVWEIDGDEKEEQLEIGKCTPVLETRYIKYTAVKKLHHIDKNEGMSYDLCT